MRLIFATERRALIVALLLTASTTISAQAARAIPVSVELRGFVSFIYDAPVLDLVQYRDPVRITLTYEAPDRRDTPDSDNNFETYYDVIQDVSLNVGTLPNASLASSSAGWIAVLNDWPGDSQLVDGDHLQFGADLQTTIASSAQILLKFVDPLGTRLSDDTVPRDLDNPFPYQVATYSLSGLGDMDLTITSVTPLIVPETSASTLIGLAASALLYRLALHTTRGAHS